MHIDPSKIIFGWDISLRATGRCRNATTSRWLRDSDGSECNKVIMERNFMSQKSGRKHDLRRNSRGEMEKLPCNSIQADLESSQKFSIKGDCHWHNLDSNDINKTEYTEQPIAMKMLSWNVYGVGETTDGGLSLGWKGNSLIKLKNFSSQHIDVEVYDNDCGVVWRLMGLYGSPDKRKRYES
ncbi:hypothetical protein GOBAR_AA18669 [Gossypium barbadense]|uniref:Uncharacterized protein n=1 Tax=Gossypium barbadense TaxID=3634 RepID=A0A2P5XFB5_GOSBA|nr:hypothetical protein GOBAR_AA18669 [Gossypium barbadense]